MGNDNLRNIFEGYEEVHNCYESDNDWINVPFVPFVPLFWVKSIFFCDWVFEEFSKNNGTNGTNGTNKTTSYKKIVNFETDNSRLLNYKLKEIFLKVNNMELEGIMERLERISKEIIKMRREVDEIEYTVYYETPEVMNNDKNYNKSVTR